MPDVVIPVRIRYDGTGFKQLTRDAQQAERAAMQATRQQIQAQRNLQRLTANLDRGLAKDAAGKQPSLAQQIGGQFVAASALAAATAGIKQFAADSVQGAMAAERLGLATENLGRRFNVSGEQITKSIQDASLHTINQLDAMQIANQAMLLGVVKSEEEFAELAQLGIVLGRAMGQDARKSMEDITIGLGRQSPRILDNLGLLVSIEEANRKYAKSLGVTVEDLTDAQKAEAFRQEALEQGRAKVAELGGVTLDSAGKAEQLAAKWKDFSIEFGKATLAIGDGTGTMGGLADAIDRLSEGAKGWQTAGDSAKVLQRGMEILNKEGDSTLGWMEEIPIAGGVIRGLDFWGSQIFRSEELGKAMQQAGDEIWNTSNALDANTGTVDDNTAALEANEEELKRLERAREIQRDSVAELLAIEEQYAADSTATWDDWRNDVSALNSDTWKRLEKIGQDGAKRQKQIQADLTKDLAAVDKDLARDLARARADTEKRDRRAAEDAARQETRARQRQRIDALADERLFQFELRQMAAEGDAIGIAQALERRAIEEQIAAERSQAEQQIEAEDAQIAQQRQREDDAERIRDIRDAAAERKAEIEQAALEAAEAERVRIREVVDAENEAYSERLAALEQSRTDKLVELENGRADAIQVLGEELSQVKDLTTGELVALESAAGQIGRDVGVAFSYGLSEGARQSRFIDALLGFGGGGDLPGGAGSSTSTSNTTMQRDIPGFANGGTVPGPLGAPMLAVVHGGENITRPGQGAGVTVNISGVGVDLLAQIVNGKMNEALEEYDRQLAAVLN